MNYITDKQVEDLSLSSQTLIDWVNETIKIKKQCILPAKISLHLDGGVFYNTMPCIIPDLHLAGVKMVNRYPTNHPSLNSNMMIYNLDNGELKAILESNLITNMRTAAVAVHSIHLFAKEDYESIAFIGLGSVGSWALKIYVETIDNKNVVIRLFNYKNRGQAFIDLYKDYKNIKFELYDDYLQMIDNCDVVVSAVTYAEDDFASPDKYKKGCLLVPIHTRGFVACNLAFDKIFGDDTDHLKGFKYFNEYESFHEVCDVVNGNCKGRENNNERIIVYNIGISIHDLAYASHIYNLLLC